MSNFSFAQKYTPTSVQLKPINNIPLNTVYGRVLQPINTIPLPTLNFNYVNGVAVNLTTANGTNFTNTTYDLYVNGNSQSVGGAYLSPYTPVSLPQTFTTFTIGFGKIDNPLDGVSTYDLLLMQRHILGLQLFTSPYQYLAADINGGADVTSFDILELRKLILGIYNEFPNNMLSWRFLPIGHAGFDINQTWINAFALNPFLGPQNGVLGYPAYLGLVTKSINTSNPVLVLNSELTILGSAIGIKMGDINLNNTQIYNMFQQVEERTNIESILSNSESEIKNESEFKVKLNFKLNQKISAFQLRFSYDDDEMDVDKITSSLLDFSRESYNISKEDNTISIAWFDTQIKRDARELESFSLEFSIKAKQDILPNATIFDFSKENSDSKIYNEFGNVISGNNSSEISIAGESLINIINPVIESINIQNQLFQNQDVKYRIVSQNGNVILSGNATFENGSLEITHSNIGKLNSGIYTIMVCNENQSFARRFVKI
jgi:hypothetical protein